MALHEYPDVIQGSDEWHDLRRGVITASVVGKLLTPTLKVADNETSRGIVTTLAAERITGWTEDTRLTDDMWRGVECEPFARDFYTEHHQPVTECGFMLRTEDTWTLGFSPDGLVDTTGLLEIKSPRAKTHVNTILADQVPGHYMAQCQAGLLVSGRAWLDFMSYVGGMPPCVIRVTPDPAWFDAITTACIAFETNVTALVAEYRERTAGLPVADRIDFNRVELKLA